jgi:hypothetical protein
MQLYATVIHIINAKVLIPDLTICHQQRQFSCNIDLVVEPNLKRSIF